MAKIIAPNEQFTGLSASVSFVNGVGETNDPHLIEWFKDKGYEVDDFVERDTAEKAEVEAKRLAAEEKAAAEAKAEKDTEKTKGKKK